MTVSITGRSPNSAACMSASVATTSCASFSYVASSLRNARINGTSCGVAGLICMWDIWTWALDVGLFVHFHGGAVKSGDLTLRVVIDDRYPVAGAFGVADGSKPDQHVTPLFEVVFRPDGAVHPRCVLIAVVVDQHPVRHHVAHQRRRQRPLVRRQIGA